MSCGVVMDRREYFKKYYEDNKEKKREYYKENKEKLREQKKDYYKQNKAKFKEYDKEYREQNKDKMKEYIREYQKQNFSCKSCGLFIVRKEPHLCSYCNPDKRQKTKENEVADLLLKNSITFIRDKPCNFNGDCNRYRPDFLIDKNTFFLIIECDEFAHKDYSSDCELIRINNITFSLGLPCVFIRYNPDKKGVPKQQKHEQLLNKVNEYLKIENIKEAVKVEYLFY